MPLIVVSVRVESRGFLEDNHNEPLPWSNLDIHIARLGTNESDYDFDPYEDLVNDIWGSGDSYDEYDQYEDLEDDPQFDYESGPDEDFEHDY